MSDVRTMKPDGGPARDEYVEQLRQKIGTDFTDRKTIGKKKNEMGKDDFIKLMSAQLKHQDPINPMKNEQMAAQLAQFSALEQMMNVNQNLEKMAASQKPQENVLAASLIGKRVSTDSSKFMLQKGGTPDVKFDLPENAAKATISMVDARGEIVREYELTGLEKGPQSVRWDGRNGKGQEVTPGEYSFRVSAADEQGKPIQISMGRSGLVTGVVFESGKPMLIVDDKKIPMDVISQIESDNPRKQVTNAQPENLSQENKQNISKLLPELMQDDKMKDVLAASAAQVPTTVKSEQAEEQAEAPYPLWNPESGM